MDFLIYLTIFLKLTLKQKKNQHNLFKKNKEVV